MTSEVVYSLGTFALYYTGLAISPGPNFLVVVQAGLAGSRRAALAAAFGVAAGAASLAMIAAFFAVSLAGETAIRGVVASAFATLLMLMGLRLVYRSIFGRPGDPRGGATRSSQFLLGFATALTNPVTAGFLIVSAFSLREGFPNALLGAVVFAIAASWFCLLALGICTHLAQRVYTRWWRAISLGAGALLIHASASAFPMILGS